MLRADPRPKISDRRLGGSGQKGSGRPFFPFLSSAFFRARPATQGLRPISGRFDSSCLLLAASFVAPLLSSIGPLGASQRLRSINGSPSVEDERTRDGKQYTRSRRGWTRPSYRRGCPLDLIPTYPKDRPAYTRTDRGHVPPRKLSDDRGAPPRNACLMLIDWGARSPVVEEAPPNHVSARHMVPTIDPPCPSSAVGREDVANTCPGPRQRQPTRRTGPPQLLTLPKKRPTPYGSPLMLAVRWLQTPRRFAAYRPSSNPAPSRTLWWSHNVCRYAATFALSGC